MSEIDTARGSSEEFVGGFAPDVTGTIPFLNNFDAGRHLSPAPRVRDGDRMSCSTFRHDLHVATQFIVSATSWCLTSHLG